MSPQLITTNAARIFKDASDRIGQNEISDGVYKVAIEDLVYSFQHELKQMTVGEVILAIRTQSKIDKSFSISSRVIFDWINTWRQTKKLELQKTISIKAKRDSKTSTPKELTKEDKLQSIQNQFKRWLDGQIPFTRVYVYLNEFGCLTSDKDKYRIFDEAIEILTRQTKESVGEMMKPYRTQRLGELSDAKDKKSKPPAYVINKCHEISIIEIFKGMEEMETTPMELLKDKI